MTCCPYSTLQHEGSSIKDVRSEGERGLAQMRTNADKGEAMMYGDADVGMRRSGVIQMRTKVDKGVKSTKFFRISFMDNP